MNFNINWGNFLITLWRFFESNAIGIVLSVALIYILSRVVVTVANKYIRQEEKQITIRKWVRYISVTFSLVWILVLYYSYTHQDTPFFLFLIGLLLAGVALSLREVFSNVVGWLIIVSSKGFKQGDRIEIGNVAGDVIDIGVIRTVIAEIGGWVGSDQSTGRLVSIPNSMVLNNQIQNYTQGFEFIWDELKIVVTFESDWKRAEQIMLDIASKDFNEKQEQIQERLKRVRRIMLLRLNYITPKVYVKIADSGVELMLRYLVRARRRRTVSDDFTREILDSFERDSKVELAYPTTRFFYIE